MLNFTLDQYLSQFEVIIFDLDGVILDSGTLKVNCMREVLNEFDNNLVESFLALFKHQFGKNRIYHFKNFFTNYLKKIEGFEEFYQLYAGRYADLLKIRYPLVDLCEHAEELIKLLAGKSYKLFVATGTATEEAELVLTKKGLRSYFKNILGSPCEKAKAIELILHQTKVSRDKTILIGDASHDRNSAFANEISFLFVEQYSFVNEKDLRDNIQSTFLVATNLNPCNPLRKNTES